MRLSGLCRPIPVLAGQRQAACPSIIGFHQQGLENVKRTSAKTVGGGGHIQSPGPVDRLINEVQRPGVLCFQALDPMPQCQSIMFAQAFHIPHFEIDCLPQPEGSHELAPVPHPERHMPAKNLFPGVLFSACLPMAMPWLRNTPPGL